MTNRILWSQAYAFFTSSENITLRVTSEKYGINYDSLRQKASKEGWTWKKEKIFKNAYALMDNRTSEEIARRNQEQIELARVLLLKATQAIAAGVIPKNAKEVRQWAEIGVKIERLALGLDKSFQPKVNITNSQWQRYNNMLGNNLQISI